MAYPSYQFAILLNAGETSSKFITYPEMVKLAEQEVALEKEMERKNASLLSSSSAGRSIGNSALSSSSDNSKDVKHKHLEELHTFYDKHLLSVFSTVKMPFIRVEPQDVERKMTERPALPPVAQMELHLLIYPYEAISHVFIRLLPRPR